MLTRLAPLHLFYTAKWNLIYCLYSVLLSSFVNRRERNNYIRVFIRKLASTMNRFRWWSNRSTTKPCKVHGALLAAFGHALMVKSGGGAAAPCLCNPQACPFPTVMPALTFRVFLKNALAVTQANTRSQWTHWHCGHVIQQCAYGLKFVRNIVTSDAAVLLYILPPSFEQRAKATPLFVHVKWPLLRH